MFSPASVYRYVCKQLSCANSYRIVTKLRQSYPWPQAKKWLNFGRSKVKVGGEVCTLLNALLVISVFSTERLIDSVVVLRPTRHKIGHFGDVLPGQTLGLLVLKN